MNTPKLSSLHLLTLLPFDTYMQLEEYIYDTLKYHQHYRSVDIYGRLREPLFHGHHTIGISYDMEANYANEFDDQLEYFCKLSEIYNLENTLITLDFNFELVFQIYLNDYFVQQVDSIWKILPFQYRSNFHRSIEDSLDKAQHHISQYHYLKKPIFGSNSVSYLLIWTNLWKKQEQVSDFELIRNWFHFLQFSPQCFSEYIEVLDLLENLPHLISNFETKKRQIVEEKQEFSHIRNLWKYPFPHNLEQFFVDFFSNYQTGILNDLPKYIHQTLIHLKHFVHVLQKTKNPLRYKCMQLTAWRKQHTFHIAKTNKNRFVDVFKYIFLFISIFGIGVFCARKSHAMIPVSKLPNIVVCRDDLELIGRVGTYYDLRTENLERENRNKRAKLSLSLQRAHNVPMKTWQVLEIPKNNTPVTLLDSPTHQFLDTNRRKFFKNIDTFQDEYFYHLVEKGLIASNGVWTQKGVHILEQLTLDHEDRLNVENTTIHKSTVIEALKHLQIQETLVLKSVIQHDLEIPMAESGRFLINRKIIATVDSGNRDLKSRTFQKRITEASFKSPEQINEMWIKFSRNIEDFATLIQMEEPILDTEIAEYTRQDLARIIRHVGNHLNQQQQNQFFKTLVRQLEKQMQTNIFRKPQDSELFVIAKRYNLLDPHQTMAKSLRFLFK